MPSESDIESQLSGIFTDVARRLAAMPLLPEARREVYGRFLVGAANAAGISMDGKTFYDPAEKSPEGVEGIADALGTKATAHRNSISVYPFVRPSLGSSGTVVYTDKHTNELMTLLVRRKRDPGQWTYPAGYMELLPEGEKMVPGRGTAQERDKREEQTVGMRLGETAQAIPGQAGVAEPSTSLPKPADIKQALDGHYRSLLAEKGWQEADELMRDGGHIRAALESQGLGLPGKAGVDVTAQEAYKRELREETALDLSGFPDAHTQFVRADMSLVYSSGGQRSYTANPHFLTDLGVFDTPPAIAAGSDTTEAAWVPVRNIRREADGQYAVHTADGKAAPLNPYAAPAIEQSLNAWLSSGIAYSSGGRFSDPRNVQVELGSWGGKERLRSAGDGVKRQADAIASDRLSPDGMLPELTGEEGARRIRDYLDITGLLSAKRQPQSGVDAPRTM